MRKNTTFMFAAAVAALLLAGCDKEQQGYDSFILDIAGFSGADGSKAHWDDSGFWWEATGDDAVCINGELHQIFRDGNQWKTHAGSATGPIDGNYYIVYAGTMTTGEKWNGTTKLYGPVQFDGKIVPLARSGSGNRMTLDPCCAVIKMNVKRTITFTITNGSIATEGYINPSTQQIVNATEPTPNSVASKNYCANVDGYYYYIIPIVGEELVCSQIKFGTETTSTSAAPITIKKGTLYTVNIKK